MRFKLGPNDLGAIYAAITDTQAVIPIEVVHALTRWDRLRRAPRPARPNPDEVISRAGQAACRNVRTAAATLRLSGVPEPEDLLPAAEIDKYVAEIARADFTVKAFDAARAYSGAVAVRVVNANEAALIEALQARYAVLAKTFGDLARTLPPGLGPDAVEFALPELVEAWGRAVECHTEMGVIRAVVIDTLDRPTEDDALAVAYLRFTRSPLQREQTPFKESTPTFGDPSTRLGALGLARLVEPDELWCPTARQARARAAELWPTEVGVGLQVVM